MTVGTAVPLRTIADKCVIWHAPYTGDVLTVPGTLLDPSSQEALQHYLANAGRLFINGQNVAFGLTQNKTVLNPFVTNVLKVTYVGTAGAVTTITPGKTPAKGAAPIGAETFYDVAHVYPPGDDFPATGPLGIGSTYAARNQVAVDNITSSGIPVVDVAGIDYLLPNGNPAIEWYADLTSAALGKTSKVVYSNVGWEAIDPALITGTTTLKNRRVELIHNVLDYLRTGTLKGKIVGSSSGTVGAITGESVFVRAVSVHTGKTVATANSTDGTYTFAGLDPTGSYYIDAVATGYLSAIHTQTGYFHGATTTEVDLTLVQAAPGSITGKVTDQSGTPVAGAFVTATDTSNPSLTYTSSVPTQLNDGTYVILNVPVGPSYIVRVSNLAQLAYSSSKPPSYGGGEVGAAPAVTVNTGVTTPNINFQLIGQPGVVTGTVHKKDANGNDTGIPILNAIVTATGQVTGGTGTPPTFVAKVDPKSPNGSYSLSLIPGTYSLVASAPGYGPSAAVAITITANQRLTENFLLGAVSPGTISGLVATSSGVPLGGATVTVTDLSGNVLTTTQTTTPITVPANSYVYNYKVTVAAGSQVNVTASKPGYNPPGGVPVVQTVTVVSGQDTPNINFILDALHTFPGGGFGGLTLVSAPFEYNGATQSAATLFGIPAADVANHNFLFDTWGGSGYIKYPTPPADTFHLGIGYFLAEGNQAITLSLTQPGLPASQVQPGNAFRIHLKPGWNMIGDPYPFSINFLNCNIEDPLGGAQVQVLTAQHLANPPIGAALWTYTSGNYQLAYTLDAYVGYWLFAFRQVDLIVPISAQQSRAVARGVGNTNPVGAITGVGTSGNGWQLTLRAQAGTLASAPGIFGVAHSAAETYDLYKLNAPPAVGSQSVSLTFPHADWTNKSGDYSVDIRSANVNSHVWKFNVASNVSKQPVVLNWSGTARLPAKESLVLTDLDTNTQIDLRTRQSYTVAPGATTVRHFQLEARRSTAQTLQVLDLAARPSIGRGVSTTRTVAVSYRLTSDATVSITVTRNGSLVRRMTLQEGKTTGPIEALWDLKTDQGKPARPDVYMLEVRAEDSEGHVVRSVIPVRILDN